MVLYGWDASDFDHDRGPMDMAAARAAGIDFFTHKYTESTSTKHHPAAAMNAARAAGIPFLAAYVVPRTPGPSVAAQAAYLIAYADQVTPWWRTFPGWFWQVDTEKWTYDSVSAATGAAMCAELRKRTGKATIHYAPKWAYGDDVPQPDPLWASNYVSGSGDFRTLAGKITSAKWAAYSGRTPTILQYSSSATIGRQPTCDANLFRGTLADFAQLIGGVAPAAPAAKEVSMIRLILADPKASKDYGNGGVYLTNGATGLGDHNHIGPTLNTAMDKAGVPLVSCATVDDMMQAATFAQGAGMSETALDALAEDIADHLVAAGSNPLTSKDIPALAEAVRQVLGSALKGDAS
jgi:hypothetical protein